jgi:hypothetical protein
VPNSSVPFDVRRIEREVRKRLADWRELLRRQTPVARQIVSHLLDGRILCTPNQDERLYTFTGRVKFDQLLSGVVPTVGMVPLPSRISNPNPLGDPSAIGLTRCS